MSTKRKNYAEKCIDIHDNERVHQLGLELFGDEDKWKSWIKTPALALGGKSPESIMVTKEGINRVRDLLGQISHGVVV